VHKKYVIKAHLPQHHDKLLGLYHQPHDIIPPRGWWFGL